MNSLPVPTCPLCDRLAIDYEQTLAEHADFVAEYEVSPRPTARRSPGPRINARASASNAL